MIYVKELYSLHDDDDDLFLYQFKQIWNKIYGFVEIIVRIWIFQRDFIRKKRQTNNDNKAIGSLEMHKFTTIKQFGIITWHDVQSHVFVSMCINWTENRPQCLTWNGILFHWKHVFYTQMSAKIMTPRWIVYSNHGQ